MPRVFADYAIHVRLPSLRAVYVSDCVSDFVIAKLVGVWGNRVKTQNPTEAPPLLSIEEPDFSVARNR